MIITFGPHSPAIGCVKAIVYRAFVVEGVGRSLGRQDPVRPCRQ